MSRTKAENGDLAGASLKTLITRGVETYTGFPVISVELHADPEVPGTYAVRALVSRVVGAVTQDYIIQGSCIPGGFRRALAEKDAEVVPENLEDVEFTSWPPVSGTPRFF